MSVINTNVKALFSQAALKGTERTLATAMAQLSTGKRINSAKDDAAGMAISTRMTQQIRALNQAVRNAGDAIALIQTTEGATNSITDMMQRMRELAIQAISDTNSDEQRSYLDMEFQQLKKEIVRISEMTEWNGFPILNGTAGERVGEKPVYKVTANGDFNEGLTYTRGTLSTTANATVTVSGSVAKAGSLVVTANTGSVATAVLTMEDGNTATFSGVITGGVISFASTALTGGAGSLTLTPSGSATTFAANDTVSFSIDRAFSALDAMRSNDLLVNGSNTGASYAVDDGISFSNNSGSAIAKVFAINSVSSTTGVSAVVNDTVMSGSNMSATSASVTGTVTINGVVTAPITTTLNNTRESRSAVVAAINAATSQTGVVAIDSGSDTQGIRLVATDGRNIEVSFNTAATAADFASATGLKEGIQAASYSLESKVEGDVKLTSAGTIARSGLATGDYTKNVSVYVAGQRSLVTAATGIQDLSAGDLVINGIAIDPSRVADDGTSNTQSVTSSRAASATAIVAAINSHVAKTGVTASVIPATTTGSFTEIGTGTANGLKTLYINDVAVNITMATTETEAERRANVLKEINAQTPQHGVIATDTGNGGITLTAKDGRNVAIWFNSTDTTLKAGSFGLGVGTAAVAADGVKGAAGAGADYTGANTLYGRIQLTSDEEFTVAPGTDGFNSESNFLALGFEEGTYGGEVDEATSKMTPPRTGRLAFQVGASANQLITIDLADFGKAGPITGSITGDVADAVQVNNINTASGATSVLEKLDVAMDLVNKTRANMGAIMNRLTYAMDNLTNVSMNASASRSQIEDADYAAASSELAKTQIMQQAATAVLAQANTSQQTVLKLLQG